MRSQNIFAAGLVLFFLTSMRVGSQEISPLAPGKVSVTASGSGAALSWASMGKGVSYRITRSPDLKQDPVTVTPEPLTTTSFTDEKPTSGTNYYMVTALYPDGTSFSAAPVLFTKSDATTTITTLPGTILTSPMTTTTLVASPMATPTAVNGVTVSGSTTKSATITWSPVPTAATYTIRRNYGGAAKDFTGITGTTFTDAGPVGTGFYYPGVYTYDVTANLVGGATVTGQGSWTRPDPTCDAPSSSQSVLTVLDPTSLSGGFGSRGPYPSGAVFSWDSNPSHPLIAFRAERSVQGSNQWVLAATSCGGPSPISFSTASGRANVGFSDPLGGIVQGTTYLYRITGVTALGEVGMGTVTWVAPTVVPPHWLSATASGNTMTLRVRYEPPATNAPIPPITTLITSDYGFSFDAVGPCSSFSGCTKTIIGAPSGTHVFTVTSVWSLTQRPPALAQSSSNITVVVP